MIKHILVTLLIVSLGFAQEKPPVIPEPEILQLNTSRAAAADEPFVQIIGKVYSLQLGYGSKQDSKNPNLHNTCSFFVNDGIKSGWFAFYLDGTITSNNKLKMLQAALENDSYVNVSTMNNPHKVYVMVNPNSWSHLISQVNVLTFYK